MKTSPNSKMTRLQRLETVKESPPSLTLLPQSFQSELEDEGGLNLGQLFGAVRRRLPVVVFVTTVVAVATLYWSRTQPSTYEAKFRLLIEPVTAESEVVSSINGANTSVQAQDLGNAQASPNTALDYPTQIEILLSPQLLEPIVNSLEADYPDLTYERLAGSLMIERVTDKKLPTKILEVNLAAEDQEFAQRVLTEISEQYINYSVSERQTNLRRAIQFVDQQLPKVEGQVRQFEQLLQRFREQYQLIDPATFGGQVSNQSGAIQGQLADNQIALMQTRQLYTSLQKQLQLSPASAEAATVLTESPSYQKLRTQLEDIEAQLAIKSAELTSTHPEVVALRQQRDQLLPLINDAARNSLGQNLSGNIADTAALPYQNSLRTGLSKQFVDSAIQLQVLEAKREGILGAQKTLQQQMGQLPAITRQYENLQRKLQIASDTYRKFLEKREELLINAARNEVPWELLGKPSVSAVSDASLSRDLALGTMLGLLLGIGIAILLDKTNDAIHSLPDLRAELKRPVLGIIPLQRQLEEHPFLTADSDALKSEIGLSLLENKEQSSLLNNEKFSLGSLGSLGSLTSNKASEYSFSPFLEAFRSLYSQLHLLNPDLPISSLVISSCSPQEGKTTTSMHLAQAAAAMGRKVLLVDADLRAPKISRTLNLPNSPGLSDLMATEGNLQSTIHPLPGVDNLFVLTAGMLPSDPTRILASQKMQSLMGVFDEQFDLVIYDCPPLNLADPTIIAPQTDGLMVVAQLGSVPRGLLKESMRMLEIAQIPILGVVANGMKN